jgi:hypothetical protein
LAKGDQVPQDVCGPACSDLVGRGHHVSTLMMLLSPSSRSGPAMAIYLLLSVGTATHHQHDDLDARMGQYLEEAGGPPTGLMSHVTYPDGHGFVVAEVWRTEAEGRSFVDNVLRPVLTESGFSCGVPTTRPVWGFARP